MLIEELLFEDDLDQIEKENIANHIENGTLTGEYAQKYEKYAKYVDEHNDD